MTINGAAASATYVMPLPAISPPPYTAPAGKNLQGRIHTTGINTATVTVNYYIAEFPSPGTTPVINPSTGDKVVENNTVTGTGWWDPIDARDPVTPVSDTYTVPPMLARRVDLACRKAGRGGHRQRAARV